MPADLYKENKLESIEECLSNYRKFISQIRKIGVDVDRTRFGFYLKQIPSISELNRLINEEEKIENSKWINSWWVITELRKINFIHESLIEKNQVGDETLLKLCSGPNFALDEKVSNSSNSSRDILSELELASHFSSHGVEVDFSTTADIILKHNGIGYAVEVKRPQTEKSILKNIGKAKRQIERRISNDIVYGITAIDIGKLTHKQTQPLYCRDLLHPMEIICQYNHEIAKNYEFKWRSYIDETMICVILFNSLCFFDKNTKRFGVVRSCHFFSPTKTKPKERLALKQLHSCFNNDLQSFDPQEKRSLDFWTKYINSLEMHG